MMNAPGPVYPLHLKVAAHGLGAVVLAGLLGWKLAGLFGLGPWAEGLSCGVVLVTMLAAEPTRRSEASLRFGPGNRVTLTRAVLVGSVAAFIGSPGGPTQAIWVSGMAFIALVMDGLDGWVARRTGLASAYGARLDMEVDALLMLVLSVLAWQWGQAGPWVLFCGLARYGFLLAGYLWPWLTRPLPEAFRRKTCCVIGVGGLTAALWPWPWSGAGTVLAAVATGALVLSFGIDTIWLARHRSEAS
jgi:phosphatidylglycerophosphate synthase